MAHSALCVSLASRALVSLRQWGERDLWW